MKSNVKDRNRSVTMNSSNSSMYYRNNKNRRNNVSEKGSVQDRLPNTLTHSLTLSHILLITLSSQRDIKSINIIYFLTTISIQIGHIDTSIETIIFS